MREECYQQALEMRLALAGIPYVAKPSTRRKIEWLGEVAGILEPDAIASDRVILELKVHPEGLPKFAFRQTINYLKYQGLELGLLVNFAEAKAEIRRIVFHNPPVKVIEDFELLRDHITSSAREKLFAIREVLSRVHREFGLGYSDRIYRRLIEIGLRHHGLACQSDVIAKPTFRDRRLPTSPITPLLVDESILVQVEAIHDGVSLRAIRTMQTHLNCMNSEAGIIASFGQSWFEVRGIKRRFGS